MPDEDWLLREEVYAMSEISVNLCDRISEALSDSFHNGDPLLFSLQHSPEAASFETDHKAVSIFPA